MIGKNVQLIGHGMS